MKVLLVGPQETMESVEGSSTMSYVLARNGGGALVLSIGDGTATDSDSESPPALAAIKI